MLGLSQFSFSFSGVKPGARNLPWRKPSLPVILRTLRDAPTSIHAVQGDPLLVIVAINN